MEVKIVQFFSTEEMP